MFWRYIWRHVVFSDMPLANVYIKRTEGKNLCISLIPVYLMICILSLIVFINIAFGIEVWWHYYNPEKVRVFFFFSFVTVYILLGVYITSFSINIHLFCANEIHISVHVILVNVYNTINNGSIFNIFLLNKEFISRMTQSFYILRVWNE